MTFLGMSGVGHLCLDDTRHHNALYSDRVREMRSRVEQLAESGVDCVVISSTARSFCAGLHLKRIVDGGPEELRSTLDQTLALIEDLQQLPAVTIAIIDGPARGAGADLALTADVRLGSTGASFAFPGAGFGLLFGTHRLAHLVGPVVAGDLVATGRIIESAEARRVGLLTDMATVPHDVVHERIETFSALPAQVAVRLHAALRPPRTVVDLDRALLDASFESGEIFESFKLFAQKRSSAS